MLTNKNKRGNCMNQYKINELISKYQVTGEEIYFVELYTLFYPLIKKYAYKIFFVEYEDCMQELSLSFYEAIMKMENTDSEAGCVSYIKRTIINKYTKLYHESISNQQIMSKTVYDTMDKIGNAQMIDDCAYRIDLKDKISLLPNLHIKVLNHLLLGHTVRDISKQLGYSRQYINGIRKNLGNVMVNN